MQAFLQLQLSYYTSLKWNTKSVIVVHNYFLGRAPVSCSIHSDHATSCPFTHMHTFNLNVQIHQCIYSCTGCDTDVQFPGCGNGIASCRDGHPIYSECVPNYNTGSCECRLASEYTFNLELHACMFIIIIYY